MAGQSIDDFYDPLLEDGALGELKSAGAIIKEMNLLRPRDEGDDPEPDPKQQPCRKCGKIYTSRAGWFAAKWIFSSVCESCASGNTWTDAMLTECRKPLTRQLSCPGCGIRRGVVPVLEWNLWHYHFTCPHCGTYALNVYRVQRLCAACGEDFFINENYFQRNCKKCRKDNAKNAYK